MSDSGSQSPSNDEEWDIIRPSFEVPDVKYDSKSSPDDTLIRLWFSVGCDSIGRSQDVFSCVVRVAYTLVARGK